MLRLFFSFLLAVWAVERIPENLNERLTPILSKLADFDPDMLDFLSEIVDDTPASGASFLQTTGPDIDASLQKAAKAQDVQAIIASLAPLLSHVKQEDKEKFGNVLQTINKLGAKKPTVSPPSHESSSPFGHSAPGASFAQMVSSRAMRDRLAALRPVFHKLRAMDAEQFEHFMDLLGEQDGANFLQLSPKTNSVVAKSVQSLAQAVRGLHGLDSQTSDVLKGLLGVLSQSSASEAVEKRVASFLQEDPLVEEKRLNRLRPILLKLQHLDGKTFGGLAKLVGVAKDKAAQRMIDAA